MFKRHTWEGGVADPMVVHWPKGIKAKGEIRNQYAHCSDIVPTVYECLGIEPPEVVKGYTQWDLEGTSFKYSFDDADAPTQKPSQFYVMLGTRAIWRDGWKAEALHPGAPSDWSHFAQDKWALYHVEEDRSECHDLADGAPGAARRADRAVALRGGQVLRPAARGQDRHRGAHDAATADEPTSRSLRLLPRTHSRFRRPSPSTSAAARSRSPPKSTLTPDSSGVIFAHGSQFGGHASYIKDGKPTYVYNFLGRDAQTADRHRRPAGWPLRCGGGVHEDDADRNRDPW